MKTEALVDKYQKALGGLINRSPASIRFLIQVNGKGDSLEIGKQYQIYPDKPELTTLDWCHGHYTVYMNTKEIAGFKLYEMPHCCGILVSCNAYVQPSFRGKRVGTLLNNLRQEIARAMGYTVMICTDIARNTPQRKLLKTNGWKDILEFKNKRTGNTILLSYIGL